MIYIILAAGRGNRLKKSLPNGFKYITKSLIPINNQTSIERLIDQIPSPEKNEIFIVLGHKFKEVKKVIKDKKVKIVINEKFDCDSNLTSLYLAIKQILNNSSSISEGVMVMEADSFFNNEIFNHFIEYLKTNAKDFKYKNRICSTAKGKAKKRDKGGFLDISKIHEGIINGIVEKAYINKSRESNESLKMYGITWFNKNSITKWYHDADFLIKNNQKNINLSEFYFHNIIFLNHDSYIMNFFDFGENVHAFNDYKEYLKCLDI